MNELISVKDQPLPTDRKFLAFNKSGDMAVVWHWMDDDFIYYDDSESGYVGIFQNITHWMPVPELPTI
jgi:hypothetical protein